MIDFSKLAQVTDSYHQEANTKKSKIKDSAKRRFTIRKAIKDNEDKTIEQLQSILASNGCEVSAEELEAARQQFEQDKIRDNEDADHQEAPEGAPGNDVKDTTPATDKEVDAPAAQGGDTPIPDSKVSDSLKKKVADALGETDSTEAAIKAALECVNPDEGATAEAVLAAVTEVLSGTIDAMESQMPIADEPESPIDEALDAIPEENPAEIEGGVEENPIDENPAEVLGDSAHKVQDCGGNNDGQEPASEGVGKDVEEKKKLSDSQKADMKKKIRDAMEATENTEDAIEAAVANIDPEATPEDVCETVIEIMSEIINELQGETTEEPAEETPAEEAPVDEAPAE